MSNPSFQANNGYNGSRPAIPTGFTLPWKLHLKVTSYEAFIVPLMRIPGYVTPPSETAS